MRRTQPSHEAEQRPQPQLRCSSAAQPPSTSYQPVGGPGGHANEQLDASAPPFAPPGYFPQQGAVGMGGLFVPMVGSHPGMLAHQQQHAQQQHAQQPQQHLQHQRHAPLAGAGHGALGGARSRGGRPAGAADGPFDCGMSALVTACTEPSLPDAPRAQPAAAADFVYGGNCPGLQLVAHFDGTAEAESAEAFLTQINPVKTMVINKLAKVECANPKRWNESQKVLYPCREHSAISLRVKVGPAGNRVEENVDLVCCFSTNCKRSYWKLRSSARNWMCYFDNTELSEQCRVKCMCRPQRCSSCDETKCAGADTFGHKPLLKQLEWLWERNKSSSTITEMSAADRSAAIGLAERLLERLRAPARSGARAHAAASDEALGARGPLPPLHVTCRAGVEHGSMAHGCDYTATGMRSVVSHGQHAPAPCFVMPTHAQGSDNAAFLGQQVMTGGMFPGMRAVSGGQGAHNALLELCGQAADSSGCVPPVGSVEQREDGGADGTNKRPRLDGL